MIDPQYPTDRIEACLNIAQPTAWLALSDAGAPPADLETVLEVDCYHYYDYRKCL
jgi:non-ribosomal peptide synthetase component F